MSIRPIIVETQSIKKLHMATKGSYDLDDFDCEYDSIKPYYETPETNPQLWFEITKNGKVLMRINSKYVESIAYS